MIATKATKKLIPIIILTMTTLSCSQKEKVDLIVHNATVYTVNDDFATAEAFAVKDGRFVAVGTSDEILGNYSSDSTLDMQGKCVYPGFIDGHSHFCSLGENIARYADLVGCRSFDEVLERLQRHAERYPSDWLLGRGWDQNLWPDKAFPNNKRLQELFPEKNICLTRIDGHAGLVSNSVLAMLGFDKTTRISGGLIELGTDGQPTGILLDNAYDMAKAIIPKFTPAEKCRAMLAAQKACFEAGLSGVSDAGASIENINLMDSLQSAGQLKIKISAMLNDDTATLDYFLPKGIIVKERLSVRGVKLYADGALGSRGANLIEPYTDDPANRGLMINTLEYLDGVCQRAYNAGYQVCTHAIGDAGVRNVLKVYANFLKGKNDLRWRIEHSQVVDSADFQLYGKYSVIPAIQSTHATSDMGWAADRLGPRRVRFAYAQQMLLQQNGWLVNGTDFPIESIKPLYTFFAAVARKNLDGNPAEGFQMENALTRKQALRSITIWAAKGYFEEKNKGSIEVGKEADFVVLDSDIMTIPEMQIPQTAVLHLFVSGEKVFSVEK